MLNKYVLAIMALLFSCAFSRIAHAESSIRIIGRDSVQVTTAKVSLDDVASVSSKDIKDDDAVIALQKIVVADAPAPGQKTTLLAQEILEKLRQNGVNLQEVGFYLKQEISVERVARTLSNGEVRAAIEEYLKNSRDEVILKDIRYRNNIKIAPGITKLKVSGFETKNIGQMVFNIVAEVKGEAPVTFQVRGTIDEWREMPVAARPLKKGAVIDSEDVTMARLNVQSLPNDIASDVDSLVGLEVGSNIAVGEVFRRNKLTLPPVIEKGSEVIVLYKKGLLTATATGVAMQDAGIGEDIKVRNSSSKKVISATVIEAGLVGVNQ